MDEKDKVKFEELNMEFDEKEFDDLSNEELEECKKIIEEIKQELNG